MRASKIGWFFSLLAVCLLAATGCVSRPENLVTPLGKLTPAVQALVYYPEDGVAPDGATALMNVFREKPELQKAFAGVPVQVWHDGRNVVVIVCAPDWTEVWLEDASWTVPVDELWFKQRTPHPLGFTLKPPPEQKP